MATGVDLDKERCCDCYKGRLRTTRIAVVAIGVRLEPQTWHFVETWLGGGYTECCDAIGVGFLVCYIGRLGTTNVDFCYVFGVGFSCLNLYSFVGYLYVNVSGSITSVGEERAYLSAVVCM